MPILDLGYRTWNGQRTKEWARWSVVAGQESLWFGVGTWLKTLAHVCHDPSPGSHVWDWALRAGELVMKNFVELSIDLLQAVIVTSVPTPSFRELREWVQDTQMERNAAWSNVLLWYFAILKRYGWSSSWD